MKTIIMFASNKKEALLFAQQEYGTGCKYVGVYKYSRGKGNNFYEFTV